MKKKKSFWPIGIALAIVGVIFLSIGTVIVAVKNPVQMDNDHISAYKHVDRNINDIINNNIDFQKSYQIKFVNSDFALKDFKPLFKVLDKKGNSVKDAKFEVLFTRPNEVVHDIMAKYDRFNNDLYTFMPITFPLKGRWNVFVNVTVGEKRGYLRLKLDSRYPKDRTSFDTILPMT